MSATDIARTIQLIIAPVVLISACMLFENGVLARYTSLGQRIRTMTHERFDLLRADGTNHVFTLERLQEIDRQLPLLTKRHRLVQTSALLTFSAIAIFVGTMFVIALSVALNASVIGMLALAMFLVGTGVLLIGILAIALEVRISHQALCYEVRQVMSLKL